MKRSFLLVVALFWATALLGAETSAFKSKQAQTEAITNAQADISETKQNIEGMQSVIAGLSENNQKLSIRISDIETMLKDDVNVQIADIKKNQEEQNAKLDKLTAAVTALGAALDGGTKKNAKESKTADKPATEKKSNKETKVDNEERDLIGADSKSVLAQADKDFAAKKYAKAKEAYQALLDKNYKPAYSNYMLGEIAYANQKYNEAIPYYKASVNLYDKGNYMPRLLYHTAISCDKIGKKEDANKFYAALKQAYPDSEEAKVAPTRK